MPLIALNAKIENAKAIKGMRGKWAVVKKTSMQSTAKFWLETIFPRHFATGNKSEYKHEQRNKFYRSVIKRLEGEGDGKTIDLILHGQSKRWLRSTARITATQNRATLYMQGPTYFANPKIGRVEKDIPAKDGKPARRISINIHRQPNKPAELTQVSDGDRRRIERHLKTDLEMRVNLALRAT